MFAVYVGMNGNRVAVISLAVFLVSGIAAQTNSPSARASLKIELAADAPAKSFPKSFTVTFVNVSDHDIKLPKPSIFCQNGLDGTLTVTYQFFPKEPRNGGVAQGCICDYFAPPSVLERAKSWDTIAPGAVIRIRVSAERINLEFPESGRYVFTAHYDPPHLTVSERAMLTNAGIFFPKEKLVSGTITAIKP
jgi:hypothetical protein